MTSFSTTQDEGIELTSFGTGINAVIVGASGGIGGAFVDHLRASDDVANVFQLARSKPAAIDHECPWLAIDLEDELSIKNAAQSIGNLVPELHMVIVATGILHDGSDIRPEKSWRSMSAPAMLKNFELNTIGPALIAKHFLPLLTKGRKSVFAALSARVGSIEDNRLGGWHAYRASKAALNMVIKTLSIELARRNPNALCIGLHPGTVDTPLSQPFQSGINSAKLFSPAQSAAHLLRVLDKVGADETGHIFAWDGTQIPA